MSIPMSNVLFGRVLDDLNKDPGDTAKFRNDVNNVCIAFAVLGGIAFITGTAEVLHRSLTSLPLSHYRDLNVCTVGVLLESHWRETVSEIPRQVRAGHSLAGGGLVRHPGRRRDGHPSGGSHWESAGRTGKKNC